MIGPLFAGMLYRWPDRLAIFLTIGLLAYVLVYRRAGRGDRPFPRGSLIFCGCLFLGSLVDMARGPFVDCTWLGLIFGAIVGGIDGLIRWSPPTGKVAQPPVPAGVWDRELDQ